MTQICYRYRMTQQVNLTDLAHLPVVERLNLIEALWDSLDADSDAMPLADWQREEIDRRLERLDSGESKGATWDEVRARIIGHP